MRFVIIIHFKFYLKILGIRNIPIIAETEEAIVII